ncbi:MAG: glycosyltransferase family 39 protein [Calditrichaeota bacterium]|nr:glycosyltransferase family 39 protein [Calditrichota bacterium]MCB9369590.1 glycosyltransferase family 39 protein [Calditrichota bacterium]
MNTFRPPIWLILICLLWLAAIIWIGPWGEFPLNDDWAYARPVQSLVEHGTLDIPQGWPAMTLVSMIAWGALFCLPFGFSFAALHISMITAGLIGIVLTYVFIEEFSGNRRAALLTAAVVAANPIYLNLSTTFMTDVFFYMLLIWVSILSLRTIRTGSMRTYVWLMVALTIALYTRQFALFLAVSFGVGYFLSRTYSKQTFLLAVFPVFMCAAELLLHQYVFYPLLGFTDLHSPWMNNLTDRFFQPLSLQYYHYRNAILAAVGYPGLFILVLWSLVPGQALRLPLWGIRLSRWLPFAFLLALFIAHYPSMLMPFIINVWVDFGSGALSLRDGILEMAKIAEAPAILWQTLTVMAIVSGIMLTALSLNGLRNILSNFSLPLPFRSVLILFSLTFPAQYLAVITVAGLFDRYYILLIPFAALLIALHGEHRPLRRWYGAAIALFLTAMFVFSTLSTRDYHSWNSARWLALDDLTNELKIPADHIDGGVEFNASRLYTRDFVPKNPDVWWWVPDDEYVIAFDSLDGYTTVRTYPFKTTLPWVRIHELRVLHRNS